MAQPGDSEKQHPKRAGEHERVELGGAAAAGLDPSGGLRLLRKEPSPEGCRRDGNEGTVNSDRALSQLCDAGVVGMGKKTEMKRGAAAGLGPCCRVWRKVG